MAPELDRNQNTLQSPEMDIWSLFVTLTYELDVGGFRKKPLHSLDLRIQAVQEAAQEPEFEPLCAMAIVDVEQRASAADMLDKLYAGKGRTTPHNTEKSKPKDAFQYIQGVPGGLGDAKQRAGEAQSVPAVKRTAVEAFEAANHRRTRPQAEKARSAKATALLAVGKKPVLGLPPAMARHTPNPILEDFHVPGAYPDIQQQPRAGRAARH